MPAALSKNASRRHKEGAQVAQVGIDSSAMTGFGAGCGILARPCKAGCIVFICGSGA